MQTPVVCPSECVYNVTIKTYIAKSYILLDGSMKNIKYNNKRKEEIVLFN